MRTAIDSSVLLAIFNDESTGRDWLDMFAIIRRQGQLVICDVVFAEVGPSFRAIEEFEEKLGELGIVFESAGKEASYLAGKAFRNYLKGGGSRTWMIPDFLIAAHAMIQADRLATNDDGFFRKHFTSVNLLTLN